MNRLEIVIGAVCILLMGAFACRAQAPPASAFELLTMDCSDPDNKSCYRRYSSDCLRYRFETPCSQYCCTDFENIFNEAANAWESDCVKLDYNSGSNNWIQWVCIPDENPGRCHVTYNPSNGNITLFDIEIYSEDDFGVPRAFTCSNTCPSTNNLYDLAMHEFGHAIGFNEASVAVSVMRQGECYTCLQGADIDARDYLYDCSFDSGSWGAIKSWYAYNSGGGYGSTGMDAGRFEPRSSDYNRMAWTEFAEPGGHYNVLRRDDGDEIFHDIGYVSFGDTVFVDSSVTAGHTYDYRVVSENDDTLRYTNEMPFGLLMISELPFYDINVLPGRAAEPAFLIADGQYIYIACKDKVKKIDVTDPYIPLVVGTRDISSFPCVGSEIKDMALGYYDGYLFVLNTSTLIIINGMDDNLPVVSSVTDFDTEYYECNAIAILGHAAYVATTSGIFAVSINDPANPEIWDVYTGTGMSEGSAVEALEKVSDYLYVEFWYDLGSCYTEVIEPIVDETTQSVYFNVICMDHDEPACFDYSIDLTAVVALGRRPLRGNPMGYYAVGKTDDTTFAVFNTTDPLNPTVIKTFETPRTLKEVGGEYISYNSSYAFDGDYLYIAVHRDQSELSSFYSSVYVYDLYSPGTEHIYALGDLQIGQAKNGAVASWGKQLYYFDRASNNDDYHKLQIFEKADGCDPNLDVAVSLDPIADTYEIGQHTSISWTCTGCPIRIDVQLMEDGIEILPLASLRKIDEPDLDANSISWTVEGISSDPENHTYRINVHAWNIEGGYDYCSSNVFEIVEEIGSGKGGQVPILGFGLDDGTDRKFPLPGFISSVSDGDRINYWIFPINPSVNEGKVSLYIAGNKDSTLIIRSMELIAVDAEPEYKLTLGDESEPFLTRDGKEFISVVSLLDSDKRRNHLLNENSLFVEKLQSGMKCEEFGNSSFESIEFNFAVPGKKEDKTRHYILCYDGELVVAEAYDGREIPEIFALIDPYPNPFNPVTTIEFHMPRKAKIGIYIYNVEGKLIRTLASNYYMPGVYRVMWDGCNSGGSRVASGVYFCRFAIHNEKDITKKIVLLR